MERKMLPENSNPKPEEARQERIAQLKQDEQQLRRIIEQRDAVSKVLEGDGYGYLIGLFVDPDDNVLGIGNKYHGIGSNNWRVVRCESSEVEGDQPIRAEIQKISSAKKTEHGRYPFWPIGVKTIDTIYPEDGRAINIFWMSKSESEAKHRGFIVGDLAGNEFLPLDEIIDPETERKMEAKIKAKEEADEFDRLVQSLRDEGLGADAERCVQAGLDLGATAVYDVMV
ncbi:MAG: hypothetical protein D8G53_12220 [Candidatus Saccharimonas sp.]|nr:MAG: hypothetical protein D8G53_12220 [Candidatus Saccharimonas sp.]